MPFYQKPLVANERNNQGAKAYSHATTKDKEIRAGNRERGKPLKIQYIIGQGRHSRYLADKAAIVLATLPGATAAAASA